MTKAKTGAPAPKARHPRRIQYGHAYTTMLSQVEHQRVTQNEVLKQHGWTGRSVMGYKLPHWQRQEKWSQGQCVRFIESIWYGLGLGTYMVNQSSVNKDADLVLLDGQQRLRAIQKYWDDEFAIVGEDGNAYFWSQLEDQEKAQFLRIPFAWVQSNYDTEQEMTDAYNRNNFGGTPHEESERA